MEAPTVCTHCGKGPSEKCSNFGDIHLEDDTIMDYAQVNFEEVD